MPYIDLPAGFGPAQGNTTVEDAIRRFLLLQAEAQKARSGGPLAGVASATGGNFLPNVTSPEPYRPPWATPPQVPDQPQDQGSGNMAGAAGGLAGMAVGMLGGGGGAGAGAGGGGGGAGLMGMAGGLMGGGGSSAATPAAAPAAGAAAPGWFQPGGTLGPAAGQPGYFDPGGSLAPGGAGNQMLSNFGGSMLAQSGWQQGPGITTGEAIGKSLLYANEHGKSSQKEALEIQLLKEKIAESGVKESVRAKLRTIPKDAADYDSQVRSVLLDAFPDVAAKAAAREDTPTNLEKLISLKAKTPTNDPNYPLIEQAIRREAAGSGGTGSKITQIERADGTKVPGYYMYDEQGNPTGMFMNTATGQPEKNAAVPRWKDTSGGGDPTLAVSAQATANTRRANREWFSSLPPADREDAVTMMDSRALDALKSIPGEPYDELVKFRTKVNMLRAPGAPTPPPPGFTPTGQKTKNGKTIYRSPDGKVGVID